MFTYRQLEIIKFCAQECEHQESGEMSVYCMLNAYDYANKNKFANDADGLFAHIHALAYLVDPRNKNGIRKVNVQIGDQIIPPTNLEHSLRTLCNFYNDITPEEFYQRFEEIHPFIDGNGRVGAIIYNILNDTLEYPASPPEFISNRKQDKDIPSGEMKNDPWNDAINWGVDWLKENFPDWEQKLDKAKQDLSNKAVELLVDLGLKSRGR